MKNINYKKTLLVVFKLCALAVLMGAAGGFIGGCFAHFLSFVTGVRTAASWLILLLPLGGIATVVLYRVFRMSDYRGTNEIIHGLVHNRPIRFAAAPLIFVSTGITHLFGGSAGREGAALQLGGTIGSALSVPLRLNEQERTVFMMSGMSAVFAGVFGTPLTAAFFVLEFQLAPKIMALGILPCFLSAITAEKVSALMGVAEEAAHFSQLAAFSLPTVAKILVLALGLSVLGRVMCFLFHNSPSWSKKLIANPILRTALGAAVLVGLTALVGDMRYNGSGMPLAMGAVEGRVDWYDFILKILFTSVTLAAGLKGGEIVPTFCIGATFGGVLGSILGLDMGFSAALGLVGLFCCASNGPVSAVFLGIEMFGLPALPYYILICLILWPLSVRKGLFENRLFKPLPLPKRKASPIDCSAKEF